MTIFAAASADQSQPHIVEFLHAKLDPRPEISLEYIWGGSLDDHLGGANSFSRLEVLEVLRQAMDVLVYLHGLPIIHRDVSAKNILLKSRGPRGIFIKFADFGLAKEGEDLSTFCGNNRYAAPDIYRIHCGVAPAGERYTSAVDIWSTGVVVVELLCGLPRPPAGGGSWFEWHDRIHEHVRTHHINTRDALAPFLLGTMLALDPADRAPAAECHEKALELLASSKAQQKAAEPRPDPKHDRPEAGEETFRAPPPPVTAIFRGQDAADACSSQDAGSVDHYLRGFRAAGDAPLENTPARRARREQVQRLLGELRDPEKSLFTGTVAAGLNQAMFDIKDGSSIASNITRAVGDAASGSSNATSATVTAAPRDSSARPDSPGATGLPDEADVPVETIEAVDGASAGELERGREPAPPHGRSESERKRTVSDSASPQPDDDDDGSDRSESRGPPSKRARRTGSPAE